MSSKKAARLGEKLRRATPHWTRHTDAPRLLDGGAELTTVRDNLRHSSLATTSMYLHADDARRAKQVSGRFAAPSA
jgi:site-specific recombinase XerD